MTDEEKIKIYKEALNRISWIETYDRNAAVRMQRIALEALHETKVLVELNRDKVLN